MRQLLFITLFFAVIFGTSYWYTSSAFVCPAPIKYKLGDIDKRFNLSKEEAKEVLLSAESVWEKEAGRELFSYDDKAIFLVSFIYDERQQMASTEEEWRMSLDVQEKAGTEALEKVKDMSKEYENLQSQYQKQRSAYEARLSDYNSKVESYNKQGGAPEDVFKELQDEQDYLSSAMKKLIEAEKSLNSLVDEINNLGEEGNKKIEDYNNNVHKYNEVFGNLDTFTQGDFQRQKINIYKFSNPHELTRVIAHEFGHALGIAHVEDKDAIMYYLMKEKSDRLELSTQDRDALLISCGDGTGLSEEVRSIIRKLLAQFNI